MHCFSKFLNTSLRPKTRYNISSAPNIECIPKKHLRVQVHPAGRLKMIDSTYCAAMMGFFKKAEISSKQLKWVGTQAKSSRSISFRFFAVAASNGLVESENIQVFISFRGETRTGFTGHLYKGLIQAGYCTFIDDLMRRGENIDKELTKTIRNSEVSVIVISPGYASSQSCLDELAEILHCRSCFGLKVLPVFYLVDPDDVCNLRGNFGTAFDGLVKRLENATDKRVNRWKKALKEVANISGLVLCQYQYETCFIDQIVAEVEKLLSQAPQHVPSFVVVWHSFIHGFNSWLQTAPSFESYIIIECGRIVAASKYLFRCLNEGLMAILLGIAVSLYLGFVNWTEKLKNVNDLLQR